MSDRQQPQAFVWPYRGGSVGPLGNSPKDLRDFERLLNAIERTEVEIVHPRTNVVIDGYEGIITDTLVNLDDWC